jgi:aerobic carbon-monoxide dehydrogenase large subunit
MSGSASGAIGQALPRREDRRFLKGEGRYLDDIGIPGALHVCFVRSPHAHARIGRIETEAARVLPGVVAVLTGRDLLGEITTLRMAPPIEGVRPTELAPLPIDKARFVGDPVACVVAVDRYVAEDAAEMVEVDYEPLPAIASMAAAGAEGAALVDESVQGNLVAEEGFTAGDPDGAFRRCTKVVEARFVQHRQTHLPIETRGIACIWDPGREHLTVHVGNQAPHPFRTALAARLRLSESQVTVISPDVGGGFGQKIALLREELVTAALARRLARPVRWREDRLENLLASLHAREETVTTEAAVDAEGRLLALRARIEADMGAYCFFPANYMMRVVGMILPGPYRLRDYAYDLRVRLTNKCPAGPMRAPMAITSWVIEGTMDAIARELGLDPVEVRRRNLLQDTDLPYVTATGERYHSISPAATMEAALEALDYAGFRARQAERRAAGRLVGLGICNVVESTTYGSAFYKAAGIPGSGHETATVRVEPCRAPVRWRSAS